MCKYSMRVTEHYGYICIGYALVLALGILFFAPKEEEKNKQIFTLSVWNNNYSSCDRTIDSTIPL